MYIYAGNSI